MTAAATTRRVLLLASMMGRVASAAIVGRPHANADQYAFISQLDAEGVYYRNINTMIDGGKIVCSMLRDQDSIGAVMSDIMTDGKFNALNAARILVAAAAVMCPDTIPYINQQLANAQGRADQPQPTRETMHQAA